MTFKEVLAQVLEWLQHDQRLSYRAVKRQFSLTDDYFEDLKDALLYAYPQVSDDGRGLVWTGAPGTAPAGTAAPAVLPAQVPLAYTPLYLVEKILTSRRALEGERKQVTVLFADLKDSTELIRGLDPEAAQQLLDPALHRMMDAVHRFESTVNQVLGDGIMALFGAPIAHEDHALRACYAALAMQAAMRASTEDVRRTHGLELRMRVGLHSGEVVVRAIGNDLHMDYSAVGETTVLAARMEQTATPGSIRLTPATLRLVEGLVQVDALGPVPVKGLVEPVEVFELLGASGVRRRLQAAAPRGLTRFVGRDQELVIIQQALAQASTGHGQVVALVGEPGVGKSRLVYEFTHSHCTQAWRVLESASVSYGKATPYFPVIDLLRRYGHVDDGDDLRTIRAKVTGQVLTLDATLQALLPALLGDDAHLAPLKQLLIERTHGNPFFLEESVRTLVETGGLVGTLGVYRLAQTLPTIQVPATVQAMLAARIDRLPPEDKHLLQTAAVIGTEVPFALLQAIAAEPEERLQRGLTHLQAAEFLYETRLFPEWEYTFKHALTHEVAYGGLLQERRHTLHARIVAVLEALPPERLTEQVNRLAHHAVRGEVWDKALAYCRQAGAKAVERAAFREAEAAFAQALGALEHLPEHPDTCAQAIDLRLDLRSVLAPLAEYEKLFAHLRAAEALAEALGDQRRLGQIAVLMGWSFRVRGDYDHTIAASQRALAIAEGLGDVPLQVSARYMLGHVYHLLGDYHRAIDLLRSNVACLEGELRQAEVSSTGLGRAVPPAVTSRTSLVLCLAEVGAFAEGSARSEEGVAMAEAVAHPVSVIFASRGVGLLALRQGEVHKAIPALERGLTCCQEAHLPFFFLTIAPVLGAAYTLAGRVAAALPLLEQVMEQATATRRQDGQALWVAYLSEATLRAGRPQEALAHAQQALELARTHKERGHEAWTLRLLGDIAMQRDPAACEEAATAYRQALSLAQELGMRPLQAHCHRGFGMLYVQTGQLEQARTELSTAIKMYQSMEMTFWLSQAGAALTQMEGR